MEFFLDSANISEIKEANQWGILDGITTNPSLIAKSGIPFKHVIKEISEIVKGPISAEVIATDTENMLKEGRELSKISKNIVIKVPLTTGGLKTIQVFSTEEIKTNVTLCFSPVQALLAAKAGATYISPFIGRLDDISNEGIQLIREIQTIYSNYKIKTKILVASIRHPLHLKQAAMIGADVATIPFKILNQLVKHPLTDIGLENFLKDAQKIQWE